MAHQTSGEWIARDALRKATVQTGIHGNNIDCVLTVCRQVHHLRILIEAEVIPHSAGQDRLRGNRRIEGLRIYLDPHQQFVHSGCVVDEMGSRGVSHTIDPGLLGLHLARKDPIPLMLQPRTEGRLASIYWKVHSPDQTREAVRDEHHAGCHQAASIEPARFLRKPADQLGSNERTGLPAAKIQPMCKRLMRRVQVAAEYKEHIGFKFCDAGRRLLEGVNAHRLHFRISGLGRNVPQFFVIHRRDQDRVIFPDSQVLEEVLGWKAATVVR